MPLPHRPLVPKSVHLFSKYCVYKFGSRQMDEQMERLKILRVRLPVWPGRRRRFWHATLMIA